MILHILRGLLGLALLIGIAYAFSNNKKNIDWRLVLTGVAMQLILAVLLLKIPIITRAFQKIVDLFLIIISSSQQASAFLFGDLANPNLPFGFVFTVLPIIIFFSALTSILYYYGILQKIVFGFAWVMNKTMRLTGAESLASAANVFIGQTEAPLVIKPYLEKMSRSEIMTVMCGGFATIAGSVFGAYIAMVGGTTMEGKLEFGLHLLIASIISAPAAILMAKIIIPENKENRNLQEDITIPKTHAGTNVLDALSRGTTDGLKLAVNVAAMLLTFMALIYFVNALLFQIGALTGLNTWISENSLGVFDAFSLQYMLGYLFAPLAWIIGINGSEILAVGQLLGEKTILNEFVAYSSLSELKETLNLSKRTVLITAYALCGFANFASIGIQIGGISAIAPGQRKNLTELGFRALIGGTLATLMTATVASMLI